jgi:uncharacterized membrane protein YedE/YeeE
MRLDRAHWGRAVAGLALGFSLSRLGFTEFGEVHRMLTFSDLRLVLTFAGAVAMAATGFALFARNKALPRRPIHRGTVIGGVIFGLGWAVTGACPAVALVQIGEGWLPGAVTAGGLFLGTWLFTVVRGKLGLDVGSCSDD